MAETQPMRGADALAKTLTKAGVDTIFAMSGNQIMILFDALLDAQIRVVHIRHEAAAVHMADAWARLKDTVGVALVPAGPGFANALSALYTAHMSESPVVLLSGHAPVSRLGLGAFQEMPQAEMASHFAKASWTVEDPADVAQSVARAIQIAASGRPGPVHLSVPEDVLGGSVDRLPRLTEASFSPTPMPLDGAEGRDILDTLAAASRPLILVGPTLARRSSNDITEELETATGVPVIRMESPRGANDPCLGAVAEVLAESDAVLALGKLVDFSLQFGNALHENCPVLHIDRDAAMLDRSRTLFGDRLVCAAQADAIAAAMALAEHANRPSKVDPGWVEQVKAAIAYRPAEWTGLSSDPNGPVHAVELCRAVQARLDTSPDSVLIVDGGEFGQWAQACLSAPNRIINGPAGAIGGAIPFAVAAGLAKPGVPVIALMGDGSMGFHLSEFDTAARSGSAFTLIVGNDARWNAEYQIQLRDYGPQRLHSCELNETGYNQVAVALGCHGENVSRPDELGPALDRAAKSGKAACVNVAIESHPAPVIRRYEDAETAPTGH